jgi:hypothetical protein
METPIQDFIQGKPFAAKAGDSRCVVTQRCTTHGKLQAHSYRKYGGQLSGTNFQAAV